MKKREKDGFTLIELLVVISIIALLLGILIPTLSRVRHLAKRTMCATRLKDAITALTAYATGAGEGKLPLGAMGKSRISEYRKGLGWSQLDYMHERSYKPLVAYLRDTRTMMCTNIPKHIMDDEEWAGGVPFIPSWNVDNDWPAYWIGYNYLGGHFGEAWPDTIESMGTVEWESPYTLEDSGNLPLMCCKTTQHVTKYKTFIAHSSRGPVYGSIDEDPKKLAPNGSGNLGKLDGSVTSQKVKDMEKHHFTNIFGKYKQPYSCAFW